MAHELNAKNVVKAHTGETDFEDQAPTQDPVQDSDDLEHRTLYREFALANPGQKTEEKVKALWNWAKKQSKSDDQTDIVWQIVDLKNRLGAPAIGENRLDLLYRWVRLEEEGARIEAQKRQLGGSYGTHR